MPKRAFCADAVSAILLLLSFNRCFSQGVSSCRPPDCVPDSIVTIGLIVLDYSACYLTAGGIQEYSDSLSGAGQTQLERSITDVLQKKGYRVKLLKKEEKDTALLKIQALYQAVKNAIDNHVKGKPRFPERVKNFDYSLGSVEQYVNSYGVDGILYVSGFDETRTHLRRVVAGEAMAGAVAGAVTSAIMGAFLGFSFGGGGITLRPDYSIVSAGLIAKGGEVCWYNRVIETGDNDLGCEEDADKICGKLFAKIRRKEVKP